MVAVGTWQALIHCRCHDDGHAVAMHFEAMAAGAAVVTDKDLVPHLARLGFESGVHYIATESTVGTYQPLQ